MQNPVMIFSIALVTVCADHKLGNKNSNVVVFFKKKKNNCQLVGTELPEGILY